MPVRRKFGSAGSKIRKSLRPNVASYYPRPVGCIKKRDPLEPWTRQLVTTEYAQRLGFKINIQHKVREKMDRKELNGPGYYNVNMNTFKMSIMAEGKAFTTSKRPVPGAKNTNPSPCTYSGDAFATSTLIKKKFSKTPHFEWSGFMDRFKPLVDESWKLPPNKYRPIDTGDMDALLKKRVSIKGPYNLFTGPRDETSIKNHFGFAELQGADVIYEKQTYLDFLLRHPTKRRCGIVYRKPARPVKMQPELPGPASYDIQWHTIKQASPSKVPFLTTSKSPAIVSSGPGPGRYFYENPPRFKRAKSKKKASQLGKLSDIGIVVTDKKVSKILRKLMKSARKSAKAKRKRSLEGGGEPGRRSTLLRTDLLAPSMDDLHRESRRLSGPPRLSVIQKVAIEAAARRSSLSGAEDETRSIYEEKQRLDTYNILGMIGENPDTLKQDIPRKSRVASPIDRVDIVQRLSRVTVPKKARQRRASLLTSISRFSAHSSFSGSRLFTPPDVPVESLQLGVTTFPETKSFEIGKTVSVRIGKKKRTYGATEGDLDSLVEPNAAQPIFGSTMRIGPSVSAARIGPSVSRPHLRTSASKRSLTKSKTRLVSASKSRLASRTRLVSASKTGLGAESRTRLGGPSKTRLGGPSKTRLGGPSKTHLGGPSKTHLGGPSKTHLGGASKTRLGSTSKTRIAPKTPSKSNLYQIHDSLVRITEKASEFKKSSLRAPGTKTAAPKTEEVPTKSSLGQVNVSLSQAAALARARSKSKSWSTVPKNVEEILYEHPFVLDAMVAGNPHDMFPVVLVVLREGCHIHEHDLVDFVNARVSKSDRLRAGLKIMSRLPQRGVKRVNIMY